MAGGCDAPGHPTPQKASVGLVRPQALAADDLRERRSISRRHLLRRGAAGVRGGRSSALGARPERARWRHWRGVPLRLGEQERQDALSLRPEFARAHKTALPAPSRGNGPRADGSPSGPTVTTNSRNGASGARTLADRPSRNGRVPMLLPLAHWRKVEAALASFSRPEEVQMATEATPRAGVAPGSSVRSWRSRRDLGP